MMVSRFSGGAVAAMVLLAGIVVVTVCMTRYGARAAQGEVGAARSGVIDDTSYIRVAISQKALSTPCLDHDTVAVRGAGGVTLRDGETGGVLLKVGPDETVLLTRNGNGVSVALGTGGDPGVICTRRLILESADAGGTLSVPSLIRGGSVMCYRGRIEVFPSGSPGKLRLVNVLPFGDYLASVVGAEMPDSFDLEALKAQAVAARSYTVYNWEKHNGDGANVCDSVHCHVYYGVASESPKVVRAVKETEGLFAVYEGEPINAVYSSTAGGYTENNENVWQGSGKALPYLRGVPDDPDVAPVITDEAASRFIESSRGRFDRNSPSFRWREEWSREELEAILNQTLVKRCQESPGAVTPAFLPGSSIGSLLDLRIGSRGVSGRARSLVIVGSLGTWTVTGELEIRYVLKPRGKSSLNSANVVLDLVKDEAGNITKVTARGAGMGHGVGLSQWGADGMAKAGYAFTYILKHYYTGITLETLPVRLTRSAAPDGGLLTIKCFLPRAHASIILRSIDRKELVFTVNDEYRITLGLTGVIGKTLDDCDISGYVRPGLNLFRFEVGEGPGDMLVSVRAE